MNYLREIGYFSLLFLFTQASFAQEKCLPPEPFDSNAQYANTIHVSPNGNDTSGQGTVEKPYRTLARAVRNILPGTEVKLAPGNYPPDNFLSNLKGRPDAPIKIIGTENPADVIFSGGSTGIQISDPQYLVLQNLTVKGASGNGLNIDDGGSYNTPATHVVLRNVHSREIGPTGNRDGIKLSGLDHFWIENCAIDKPGSGGSGIDMVGCHDGIIQKNHFYNITDSGVQAKGGTSRILVYANTFHKGGMRAVNMGGSTGLDFFRPIDAPFEASHIDVLSNIFMECDTPVAFVGCQYGVFAHNVVYRPSRWVARILQETTGDRFVQSGNNLYANNIIMIDERVSVLVNIGPNTKPETFAFVNNLWYGVGRNLSSLPLPGLTQNNVVRQDPLLIDPLAGDFHLQPTSPAIGKGGALSHFSETIGRSDMPSFGDREGVCWSEPPTIGAYEMKRTHHQNWAVEK